MIVFEINGKSYPVTSPLSLPPEVRGTIFTMIIRCTVCNATELSGPAIKPDGERAGVEDALFIHYHQQCEARLN